jgi:Flp pilus assembly pilin Flp
MTRLFFACADLIRREKGQDLIEYALLASLVAMAVMMSVGMFGNILNDAVWVPFVRQVQNV